MTERTPEFEKIFKIFYSDGSEIREQLIVYALFIMVFEVFKEYAENRLKDFFSDVHTVNGKASEEYKQALKDYGKAEQAYHKNEKFRAALGFLHMLDILLKMSFIR